MWGSDKNVRMMLFAIEGCWWEISMYNALNVIDLNRVSDPYGIKCTGVKIRRGDLNLLGLHRNQDT